MTDDVPPESPTQDDIAARAAALEKRIAEIEAASNARLIRSELKGEALRAGMVDLDGLKLVDSAALKINEQGEVEGVAALMTQLRRSKPWLFGSASSSSPATPPPSQPLKAKLATDMNYAEWQAARNDLLKYR